MFAYARGPVTGLGKQHGQGLHPWETAKFMITVEMTVVAIAMIVQAGEHHRTAGAAAGGGGKSVAEERAVGSEAVDVRSHRRHVTVAAHRGAEVISDNKDNVLLRRRNG